MVYRITDSEVIDFTNDPEVFEFMGTEFTMSDFMVVQNLPEDVTQSLADAGYNDGYMPRGAGNSDTAVYAVSLEDFHSLGELNIALLEWVDSLVELIPNDGAVVELMPALDERTYDPDVIDTPPYDEWSGEISDIIDSLNGELSTYYDSVAMLTELRDGKDVTDQQVMDAYDAAYRNGLPNADGLHAYEDMEDVENRVFGRAEIDDTIDPHEVGDLAAHVAFMDEVVRDVATALEPLAKAVAQKQDK